MNDHDFTLEERRMLDTWTAVEPPGDFIDRVLARQPQRRWLPYAIAAGSCAFAAAAIALLVLGSEEPPVREPAVVIATPRDASTGVAPRDDATIPRVPVQPQNDPYDLDLEVGTHATVHDPLGKTRINFYSSRCRAGMQVEVALDSRFQPRTANQGAFGVVMPIETGRWWYRASCMSGGMPEAPFARGQLVVVRDAGTRPLASPPDPVEVKADGGVYRVTYQGTVPEIVIRKPPGGEILHLMVKGNMRDIDVKQTKGDVTVGLADLEDGNYTVWFTRGSMTIGRVSKLIIEPDQTWPQVQLDAPADGAAVASPITIQGTTLPGWAARFEQTAIPSDAQHRFLARVPLRPGFKSVAVRFDHPQRGTHFYVRRLR